MRRGPSTPATAYVRLEQEEERTRLLSLLVAVRTSPICSGAEADVQRRLCEMSYVERERERLSLAGRSRLQVVHLLRGFLSCAECDWLLREIRDAAALAGWQNARHRHYATEDVPLWRAPKAASWVIGKVTRALLPRLAECFGLAADALLLHECFGVRYEPSGQAALSFHRDGTMFSFNICLNEPDAFVGGGTAFNTPTQLLTWTLDEAGQLGRTPDATTTTVVRGGRGDCLMHSGQLLHGGCTVSEGVRFILVGFVAERWEADEE